jgi:hypothetical protein
MTMNDRRTNGWRTSLAGIAAGLALLTAPAGAGDAIMLTQPQQYEVMKIEKDGAKGWSAALTKAAQVGAIFYPDQPMEVEITLKNAGKEDLAGTFTLEVQPIGLVALKDLAVDVPTG